MAVQAAPAAPLYIGGAALVYGFAYLTDPEFRRAHESLGSAMAEGISDAYEDIENLLFGEDDADPNAAAGAAASEATASETARCPLIPYIHYTDPSSGAAILAARVFRPGLGGGVYFTQGRYGPKTVWSIIFIGNPLYWRSRKAHYFVTVNVDCTVPITLSQANAILSEYFHVGALRERPPHVIIGAAGPNRFPEHPDFRNIDP